MLQNQSRFWSAKLNSAFQMGINSQVLSNQTRGARTEQWQQWCGSPMGCWAPSARSCATGDWGTHILWDAARGLSLSLLVSRPAMPNAVLLWSPCLFSGFWNWPLRLTLSRALPWGALINLPISPPEDCNIPCDLKRKLSTAVAKETAETKWNGLFTMSLGNTSTQPQNHLWAKCYSEGF